MSQPDLSIVISSFNRENKVRQTLDSIYSNDLEGLGQIELILIDDGSPLPVKNCLPPESAIPSCLHFRLIEQNNAGIGFTRNRGFRESTSSLVLFLDDDIILEKQSIKQLVEAAAAHPGAVIFGSYPFISHQSRSLELFARKLFNYDDYTTTPQYKRVDAITSGLLLVSKDRLTDKQHFYRDDMTIPAAEEHEIISRFRALDIPIYQATHIRAMHNHRLELKWLSNQQYKYGQATAEAFIKSPEILKMEKFEHFRRSMEPKGLKKLALDLFGSSMGRKILLGSSAFLNKVFPRSSHNRVFGLLVTAFFYAGYKQGTKRFGTV